MIFLILISFISFSQYKEPITLDNLNSSQNDYAPAYNYFESKLYFNSESTGNTKFYCCEDLKQPNKQFLSQPINQISNISYLNFVDEENAIVSSFVEYPSQPKLNLFYAKKVKQSWIRESAIDELNGDYFILSASVSEDKSFIVFASNMGNSTYDTDLFISYKNELGKWNSPINISELNSHGSEITPHIKGNDTLYFASNGQGGKGGYDIFYSVKSFGKWQRPIALEKINSSYNDSDPFVFDDKIIFASDRPGGKGKFDLYLSEKEEVDNKNTKQIDYEINLSTYVTSINTKTQSKIKNGAIYPYIHFDENTTKIENSYKERNINTLNSIASFIKLGNEIELNVWTQNVLENEKKENSKYISDERVSNILKYFKENFQISKDKIHINYFYSENVKDYVFIYGKDRFMNVSQETERKVIIEPENLIFQLEIFPENSFSSYSIDVNINGKFFKQILSSKENPLNSKVDLKNYEDAIAGSDSLKLIVNVMNNGSEIISKEFYYQINNSYEKITNNNTLANYSFFLISPDDIQNLNYIETLYSEVKQKLNKKEYIIESSYNISTLIKSLEMKTQAKFKFVNNDSLGKEILIK